MSILDEFAPLSPAEQRLIDEGARDQRLSVGDGELPQEASPDCEVRGVVLRALLLDTSDVLHAKGLRLRGAWITGALDVQGCDLRQDISLTQCHLGQPINLVNATLRGVHLSGCHLAGVVADNAQLSGSFFLRGGSHVAGNVDLAGARIGGDVQICDVTLTAAGQDAIFAPSLRVDGSLFLGNYPYSDGVTNLVAEGTLFFSSLRAAHDVFVSNCSVAPKADVLGSAVFDATEEHGRDIALSLARAQVGGILYFRDNQIARGIVNLAGASVSRLKDEPEGPGASYPIRLDGFRYLDFSRHTDTSIAARLEWLSRRPKETPFVAQPYEQLAGVLQSMGHRNDARTVLMAKERRMREEDRALMTSSLRRAWSFVTDQILRVTIGFGYRPARAAVVSVLLILALGLFFERTWRAGDMAPNAAPVLISGPWIEATQSHPDNPAAHWAQPGQAGQDYETFQAFAYAADLLIPIVSLGQEAAWAPSTSRSAFGRVGWWLRWFAKAVGWIVTALIAGALTGVIRND